MEAALKVLSGVCWTCVYVAAIRAGLRDRTYALPLFAIALNLAWELLYFSGGVIYWDDYPAGIHAQTVINGLWLIVDVGIIVTFVRFGPAQWPGLTREGFAVMSAMALIAAAGVQAAFLAQFGAEDGARYSAFTQNLVMSVLFVAMLHRRRDTSGQSNFIAVSKLLGTLAPTIASGFMGQFRPFVAIIGSVCLAVDILYLLYFNAVAYPDSGPGRALDRFVVPVARAERVPAGTTAMGSA
ncbi:transmembrane-type terpene cyclase [Actinoplanes derwentensis]|uniref:Uncharacterized protein n=1 Tax=Actinoplanes derwentensis TaxID=113562 RepID=A0A1H1ZFK6_9ACTN|nr:hypothetical protein [Actinoplanes derwentensis]GID82410.1 hypothetical protein Ade03nite_13340 [Actinoplanes derwentensis]SDT32357.1 hypothetical protein SAMN04489716_3292 [Actinoplanes derwentensis]